MAESFRFCPHCGAKLTDEQGKAVSYSFCPFCGKRLTAGQEEPEQQAVGTVSDNRTGDGDMLKPEAELPKGEMKKATEDIPVVSSLSEAVQHYDAYVEKLRREGLDQVTIKTKAEEYFSHLKKQLAPMAKPLAAKTFAVAEQTTGRAVTPASGQSVPGSGYFSIVLKSCPNPESLAKSLQQHLVRSYLAIRMAVDKMPDIIIYKSKVEILLAVLRVFRREKAVITLLCGDFDPPLPAEKLFSGWGTLRPTVRQILKSLPESLWMGERSAKVFSRLDLDGVPYILVISDQSIYFIEQSGEGDEAHWLAIPHNQIQDVYLEKNDNSLDVICEDGREFLVTFESHDLAEEANDFWQQVLQERKFKRYLLRYCSNPQCTFRQKVDVETADDMEHCPTCQQKILARVECAG